MRVNYDASEESEQPRGTADELTFVPLAYFPNVSEAGMVCELLINNGIRAVLKGAGFGALEPLPLPGGFSEIRLLVAQPDFAQARQLYEAFFARPLRISDASADNQDDDYE